MKTLLDFDFTHKRVLVRVDFNVPIEDGVVLDNTRIQAALPTIRYLIERSAKVILLTHLGRPKGQSHERFRVDPIAKELSRLLERPVGKLNTAVGPEVETHINNEMSGGDVVLLENIRFYRGEKDNDPDFCKALARMGDAYINDAFGTAHRAHASTTGIAERLPSAAGLLLEKEIAKLDHFIENPPRPYWAIIGGAKLADKVGVIKRLAGVVDGILIGGGAAFTFLKHRGKSIGNSLVDPATLEVMPEIEDRISKNSVEVVLPSDVIAAADLVPNAETSIEAADQIPSHLMGLDIGPNSIELFESKIADAKSVLWAGPLGAYEVPPFHIGSFKIADALSSQQNAQILIGGGDTTACFNESGHERTPNIYFSTGGGAMLEYISGKSLPAIEALTS